MKYFLPDVKKNEKKTKNSSTTKRTDKKRSVHQLLLEKSRLMIETKDLLVKKRSLEAASKEIMKEIDAMSEADDQLKNIMEGLSKICPNKTTS